MQALPKPKDAGKDYKPYAIPITGPPLSFSTIRSETGGRVGRSTSSRRSNVNATNCGERGQRTVSDQIHGSPITVYPDCGIGQLKAVSAAGPGAGANTLSADCSIWARVYTDDHG